MTKGLHKDSLRKGEPNKWIVDEIIEKIRAKVNRLKPRIRKICGEEVKIPVEKMREKFDTLLSFLSDLEKAEKPMNPEAAMKELDEKIALVKQRRTWDGVDVDKYMDEVRGREPEKPSEELEKFTEKMDAWKARFSRPDDIPVKATMAFTARMFYMYPKVAREWYESLPKATQD